MSVAVVVGAGIVGASVAYHLARAGASVTLLDQAASPAAGVTGDSFAWIGDAGGDWPGGALDLRDAVLGDWRRLEAEVHGVDVRWTGSLAWRSGAFPAEAEARLAKGQFCVRPDEIAALEPNLKDIP